MKTSLFKYSIGIVSVLLSFTFRYFSPVIYVFNSPHDDLMAIRQAEGILNGNWLGDWSNLTLAKPPGYALFLVLANGLQFQPEWLLWVFILATAFFAALGIARIFKFESTYKTQLVFAILILNPTWYGQDFSRIYRTSLYTALGFLFSAIALNLIATLLDPPNKKSSEKLLSFSTLLFLSLGATYGLMSITRTEGIWVLIPSLIVGFLLFYRIIVQNRAGIPSFKYRNLVSGLTLMFVFALIPTSLVSSSNLTNYGVEVVEDFYSGPFAEAMITWQSIVPQEDYPPNISITKSMREAAYRVSPAAESLRGSLEGPPGSGWKYFNCDIGFPCDEAGSWAPWEIRDAAVQALGITTEKQFLDFFKRLSTEIGSACEKELIDCRSKGTAPMLINIRYLDPSEIIRKSILYLTSFPNMEQARFITPVDSVYTPELLKSWSSVLNVKLYNGKPNTGIKVNQIVLQVVKIVYLIFQWLLIFSLAFGIFIGILRKKRNFGLEVASTFFFLEVILFSGGLALLELALGFNPGEYLYGLPAQPSFLILAVLGLFNLENTRQNIGYRPVKRSR